MKLADIVYDAVKDDERNIEISGDVDRALLIEVSTEADCREIPQGDLPDDEYGYKARRLVGTWYQVKIYVPKLEQQ